MAWQIDLNNPGQVTDWGIDDLFRAWGELELMKRQSEILADQQAQQAAAQYQAALSAEIQANGYNPPDANMTTMMLAGGIGLLLALVLLKRK